MVQAVYLSPAAFDVFVLERVLPANDAFIEDATFDTLGVREAMSARLAQLEAYRAASRRSNEPPRRSQIVVMYAERDDGRLDLVITPKLETEGVKRVFAVITVTTGVM